MSKLNLLKKTIKLSNTENIILDNIKKFAKTNLFERIKTKQLDNRQIYKDMGNLGMLGPTIDGYGGLGLSYKMYGLINKEIEYVDSGLRSMYSVQSSLVMSPIFKYGSVEIKDKYLSKLHSGDYIGCFGLTEPESGSDAANMKSNAIYKDNKFILNGSKTWITNSPISDVLLIWAKFENKVCGFVLDREMKGIYTPEIKDKMSLKSSKTGMIFLDNVEVPEENILDIRGMKGPLSCLNDARLGISFGVLGSAEYCIENTLEYVKNRTLFDSKLAEKQLIQYKLADMFSEYNLGLLAALEVAEQVDCGKSQPEMISLIKRNNCQKSLNIARTCRDILGGNGISEEYNIFRHMINLETVNTYEGTHNIHSLILGKYLTGHSSF